jgi:hypothetical protein
MNRLLVSVNLSQNEKYSFKVFDKQIPAVSCEGAARARRCSDPQPWLRAHLIGTRLAIGVATALACNGVIQAKKFMIANPDLNVRWDWSHSAYVVNPEATDPDQHQSLHRREAALTARRGARMA